MHCNWLLLCLHSRALKLLHSKIRLRTSEMIYARFCFGLLPVSFHLAMESLRTAFSGDPSTARDFRLVVCAPRGLPDVAGGGVAAGGEPASSVQLSRPPRLMRPIRRGGRAGF